LWKILQKRGFASARLASKKNMTGRGIDKLGCGGEEILHSAKLNIRFKYSFMMVCRYCKYFPFLHLEFL